MEYHLQRAENILWLIEIALDDLQNYAPRSAYFHSRIKLQQKKLLNRLWDWVIIKLYVHKAYHLKRTKEIALLKIKFHSPHLIIILIPTPCVNAKHLMTWFCHRASALGFAQCFRLINIASMFSSCTHAVRRRLAWASQESVRSNKQIHRHAAEKLN